MRFFLDTEFIEDGETIDLISIGIVSDNGQELYYQNADTDLRRANDFVRHEVIPRLEPCPAEFTPQMHRSGSCRAADCRWLNRKTLKHRLFEWVGLLSKPDGFTWEVPEFWADYASYDWVALCQLFGRMIDLPVGWPMYINDIQSHAHRLGLHDGDLPSGSKIDPLDQLTHNALRDAHEVVARYHFLKSYEEVQVGRSIVDARRQESRPIYQSTGDVRSAQEEVRGQSGRENPGSQDQQRPGGGDDQSGRYEQESGSRASVGEAHGPAPSIG